MDSSRVSLVTLVLRADSFGGTFKCDRNMTLGLVLLLFRQIPCSYKYILFLLFYEYSGINLKALTKLLKTAANEDQTTLRAEDDSNTLAIIIDSPSMLINLILC